MQNNERISFGLMLTQTAELYGKTLSGGLMNIYWEDLQAYSLNDILKALSQHRKDDKAGKFMPKPADIIKILGKPQNQPTAGSTSKCSAHWRGHDCPVKPSNYPGWCNYHFNIRDKVNLGNYNMLEDKIFSQNMCPLVLRNEKYIQDHIKKFPMMRKPSTDVIKKDTTISASDEQTNSIKTILAKQNYPYSQLTNGEIN